MVEKKTPREPVADQLLYAVPQAARVLGISPRGCWAYIAVGELKTRRLGTRVLVHRRELEKFASRDHDGLKELPEAKAGSSD